MKLSVNADYLDNIVTIHGSKCRDRFVELLQQFPDGDPDTLCQQAVEETYREQLGDEVATLRFNSK